MIRGDRIKERIVVVGTSQAALARAIAVSPQAISKMVVGGTVETGKLHQIAKFLQTTPEYLTGETDDPSPSASAAHDSHRAYRGEPSSLTREEWAEDLGLVKVEEVDLNIGMGATYLDEAAIQSVERWIPSDWVRQFTDAPAKFLTIARPVGDSMYPTINDRDIILIDRSKQTIDRQEGIWALVYGGLGTIKRVRAMPDGSYKLMADNPQVREETAVDGEMFVIGRVAGVIRRT